MKTAGYLISTRDGLNGEPGIFYDYILGAGGLYVRAECPLIVATICISQSEVRGLAPVEEKIELTYGRIPRRLYDLALMVLCGEMHKERYLAITWNDGYHIAYPPQKGGAGGVEYERIPGTILDIHSHGSTGAFFSGTDNKDEQSMRLSMVLGKMDTDEPEYLMRLGVYGYFHDVTFEEVFE